MAGNVDSIHSLLFKGVCGQLIMLTTLLVVLPNIVFSLYFFLVGSEEDAKMPTLTGQWIIKNVSSLPKNLKSNVRNLNGILSLGKEICGQSWTTIWEQKYFIGSVKVYETWWNEMSLKRNANTFHVSVLSKSYFFPNCRVLTPVWNIYCDDYPFSTRLLVVIHSCIPTSQDYQTWVSVIHCAWHPLSHHYLSVLAT